MIKKKTQILYLILNGIGLGFGVIYTAFLARLLGPETFGQFSVLQNIGFLLVPLTSLVPNLVFSAKYETEREANSNKSTRADHYPSLFRFIFVLSALSFPVVFVLLKLLPIADSATDGQRALALLNIYAAAQLLLIQSFYQTRDRYARFLSAQIASVILKCLILGAVQIGVGTMRLEWALAVHLIVTLLWIGSSGIDLQLWKSKEKEGNTNYLKQSKKIFGPSLVLSLWSTLIYSLDILMAQRSFTSLDLSVYAVISSISKLSILLPSALTPLVLQFGYKNRLDENSMSSSSVMTSVALTLVAGSVLSFIGQLAAPFLLPLLFQREFVFQGWAVPSATTAMTLLSILSFYVHYDFGRGRYASLVISTVAMVATLLAYFCLPAKLDISQFCIFLLAWPTINALAILIYKRVV